MSLALLHQTFDETRRLAVAGSATAPGDFRLKKLIDPLKLAGTKAQVFAKLADQASALVKSNEQSAPDVLLDLLGLATAVRYTQGETGSPGPIESIGVKVPLARPTEIPARVLQPLLQVLSRTGVGRHEVIRDGYEKGLFRDIRLVPYALAGLDDSYSEIADLFAKRIIPECYGPGIAPLVRRGYDPKGKHGAARRLQLLNRFDAASNRELVMQALENGSKEVRIAALACLGLYSDDVHVLIEHANAKSQDVRTAAYYALAQLDSEEAVNALTKVMACKELTHAWRPVSESRGPRLLKAILFRFRSELGELFTLNDRKEISAKVERLGHLLHTIRERTDKDSESMLLELFGMREPLAKMKGDTLSGNDFNLDVIRAMSAGTKAMAERMADEHATLDADALGPALQAGIKHLAIETVFDRFSQYLIAPGQVRNAQQSAKSNAVIQYLTWSIYGKIPLDPRWLDAAVRIDHLGLIRGMGTPNNPTLNAYLKGKVVQAFEHNPRSELCRQLVETMVQLKHPEAEIWFFKAVDAVPSKAEYATLWALGNAAVQLPKSAAPQLESYLPKFDDALANHWLARIAELKAQPDTK